MSFMDAPADPLDDSSRAFSSFLAKSTTSGLGLPSIKLVCSSTVDHELSSRVIRSRILDFDLSSHPDGLTVVSGYGASRLIVQLKQWRPAE
jgi:hypothetical protein